MANIVVIIFSDGTLNDVASAVSFYGHIKIFLVLLYDVIMLSSPTSAMFWFGHAQMFVDLRTIVCTVYSTEMESRRFLIRI